MLLSVAFMLLSSILCLFVFFILAVVPKAEVIFASKEIQLGSGISDPVCLSAQYRAGISGEQKICTQVRHNPEATKCLEWVELQAKYGEETHSLCPPEPFMHFKSVAQSCQVESCRGKCLAWQHMAKGFSWMLSGHLFLPQI